MKVEKKFWVLGKLVPNGTRLKCRFNALLADTNKTSF